MDIHTTTLALARRLVACRSITPEDGGALAIVEQRLAGAGFVCERMDRGGVSNLWATRGRGSPLVCLAGHVDVVPPGPRDQWSADPFEGVVRDGFLIGRGSADMKSSVAAMITAVERIVPQASDGPGTLGVLLTSDEEGDALHGTSAIVEALRQRGVGIDYCVLGEPTSAERFGDTLKNGRRGSLSGALRVKGVQCHVAYPERGLNPIHAAAPALAELSATVWDRGTRYFGPTSFQISNIHGGTGASNVVPGALDVQFNLRFPPHSPAASLRARVEAILASHGLDFELQWTLAAEPFLTPAGRLVDVLTAVVSGITGVAPELSTAGGTSDGRFLAGIAGEIVEFGPLNDTIHKIDERIAVADLAPLSSIYEEVVRRLIGAGESE